jgi:hypothetical protein
MAASVVVLGALLALTRADESAKKEKEQEQERKVTLKQVPGPVKKTILKQAGDNKIAEIEEVTQGESKFYEAVWIKDGKEVEIKVAANGKLLGKETEEAKARKDKDDGDEDEGEEEDEDEGKEQAESERAVTGAEVPDAALTALKKLAAGAKITAFAEEVEHGHTFYEGSWKGPSGTNTDVLVTASGDLVEIEERVAADQVPAAVLAAARKAAGKGAELVLEKKTMVLYEAKFRKANRGQELLLSPEGRVVENEVAKPQERKGKKGNEQDDDDEKED